MTKADLAVFYSLTSRKWKVGDFGLTAEGFSEMQKTTLYGRGYRAPELLQWLDFEAEQKSFYSKKSDIWALGCLFYEATFSKKLFKQDIDSHGWAMSGRVETPNW
jgi:serine/threonine protein kinase